MGLGKYLISFLNLIFEKRRTSMVEDVDGTIYSSTTSVVICKYMGPRICKASPHLTPCPDVEDCAISNSKSPEHTRNRDMILGTQRCSIPGSESWCDASNASTRDISHIIRWEKDTRQHGKVSVLG